MVDEIKRIVEREGLATQVLERCGCFDCQDAFIHEIALESEDWPNCQNNLIRLTIYMDNSSRGGYSCYHCYFSLRGVFVKERFEP